MVREEVHRLQSRVDVLEQVRLCWEWLSLVSRPHSLRGCGSKPWGGWRFYGGRAVGVLTFLPCQAALCGIRQPGRSPLSLLYKDSCKSHQATGPMTLLAYLWCPRTFLARLWVCYTRAST